MAALTERIVTPAALRAAWNEILANDRADGILGSAIARFAADADNQLTNLAEELTTGTYRPRPLSAVDIPKPDGGTRTLAIPAARDRVVERALTDALTPIIDPLLGPSAYGFRPGLGVSDAVQALARLRDEGMTWVLRADVDDCFPTIDVGRVRRILAAVLDDPAVLSLLDQLLDRPVNGRGGLRPGRGLPQGSPLSPMLSNLALEHLDERLCRAGLPVVRYADDLTVATTSRDDALEAARIATQALTEINMSLGDDKTGVFSFADGFTFLGEEFGPRYPPTVNDHRVIDPPRRALFLGLQGSHIRIQDGRLIVDSPDDVELLDVPTGHIERLVCFGSIGVSAGVRSWALNAGVDIALLSRRGTYLGELRSANQTPRMARLRAQLAAADDPQVWLPFARACVETKIRKQSVVLQRLNRRDTDDAVTHAVGYLAQMTTLLADATDRDGLMGIEGTCARAYFEALGQLVPEPMRFTGRSRRPPQDTVNAALSFGYALLTAEAVSAAVSAGLEPGAGLLHTDHDRRPSLALDLVEEFRPLVVDQLVLTACRRSELRPEHGRRDDEIKGVLLTKAGREIILDRYERRMLQQTRGALPGFSGPLRRHLYRQAQRLAQWIEHHDEPWTGMSWR